MKRREFLGWASVSSTLPLARVSCSPEATKRVAIPPRADGFQVVGTLDDLHQQGSILAAQVADKTVLVIRNPDDNKTVIAVNRTCTHAGCTVTWKQDQSAFVCPCHRAIFSGNGSVLQGPANKPLATYAVKLEGNSVLVKAV